MFLSDSGGHSNVWAARTADGAMRPITREFGPRGLIAVPLRAGGWRPDHFSRAGTRYIGWTLWVVEARR